MSRRYEVQCDVTGVKDLAPIADGWVHITVTPLHPTGDLGSMWSYGYFDVCPAVAEKILAMLGRQAVPRDQQK